MGFRLSFIIITVALHGVSGCAPSGGPQTLAVPAAVEPLDRRVVYPREGATIASRDSAFLFGTVGLGGVSLTVNGETVRVWPNGSWIAWVPVPSDTLADFDLSARIGRISLSRRVSYRVTHVTRPPCLICSWLDSASFTPSGVMILPPGEAFRLALRATPGAEVRLVLADRSVVPLVTDTLPEEPPPGVRAFATAARAARLPRRADRFTGWITARRFAAADSGGTTAVPTVEVILGADTLRQPWPLDLELLDLDTPMVVSLNDDIAGLGGTDSIINALAIPRGTYHWLFPTGTQARVNGRINSLVRLQLSSASVAWVRERDVLPLPRGTPRQLCTNRKKYRG